VLELLPLQIDRAGQTDKIYLLTVSN